MKPTALLTASMLALSLLLAPTISSAQETKPPPTKTTKKKKPEPPKEEPKEEPPPAPPPAEPAPTADAEPAAASNVEPPKEEWDIKDVEENPQKTYLFVGLGYRGNIIPKFLLNGFVDEGATIYSNTIGASIDIRRNNFSLIPTLRFTEYGTDDILFKQKNSTDIAGNYAMVNSGLKAIYATADLLWSARISKNVQFEYGAGFGIGYMFGNLVNNWVQEAPNGSLQAENGKSYAPCAAVGAPGTGCNKLDHQNSPTDKVGGYIEKSWFQGGSRPSIFPWISVPEFGLRIKPIKNFVGRIGLGFSLTGFWFGVNGAYGLEQKPKN